jgi:hypothetical protein
MFSLVIIVVRLCGRYIRVERFFAEDKVMMIAVILTRGHRRYAQQEPACYLALSSISPSLTSLWWWYLYPASACSQWLTNYYSIWTAKVTGSGVTCQ